MRFLAAAVMLSMSSLAAPAAGQFGEFGQPAEEPAGEPAAEDSVKTGSFDAEWPLPPVGQIDGEIRQYAARYGSAYDGRTTDRLRQIQADQADGGTATESYHVRVPDDYDPARPAGVIVFIPAGDNPDRGGQYREVTGDRNLIWISPAGVGNKMDVPWREWSAIQAARALGERYNLDPDRMYVAGFSGGGRVASRLAVVGSDFFDGLIAVCGVNHYAGVPHEEGGTIDGFWSRPNASLLNKAKQFNRLVLITGSEDFNLQNTRNTFERMRADGFTMAAYVEQEGLGHTFPDAEHFARAVELLDSPLVNAAGEAAGRAAKLEANRPGEALALYERAALHGSLGEGDAGEFKAKAGALREELAAAVAAAEAAVESGDRREIAKSLRDLRRWSPAADADLGRLTQAARERK